MLIQLLWIFKHSIDNTTILGEENKSQTNLKVDLKACCIRLTTEIDIGILIVQTWSFF